MGSETVHLAQFIYRHTDGEQVRIKWSSTQQETFVSVSQCHPHAVFLGAELRKQVIVYINTYRYIIVRT